MCRLYALHNVAVCSKPGRVTQQLVVRVEPGMEAMVVIELGATDCEKNQCDLNTYRQRMMRRIKIVFCAEFKLRTGPGEIGAVGCSG